MSLEATIRKTFKQYGFVIAAELMEFHRINHYAQKRMLASWDNYPRSMDKYPTKLLVKRTYNEGE